MSEIEFLRLRLRVFGAKTLARAAWMAWRNRSEMVRLEGVTPGQALEFFNLPPDWVFTEEAFRALLRPPITPRSWDAALVLFEQQYERDEELSGRALPPSDTERQMPALAATPRNPDA